MLPAIRQDILTVLSKSIEALKQQDFAALSELSNHTIHDASVYQDDDSLTLAILIYALGKIIQRSFEKNQAPLDSVQELKKARTSLMENDENNYRAAIKQLLRKIESQDDKLKMYIQDVIQKAKIKKATKMHEHGISIARTAELLGVSQWELQEYVGQTTQEDFIDQKVARRLNSARKAMNGTIVFDAGPIISLTTTTLIWILKQLKEKFGTQFALPIGVKQELVDKPLGTRRFKLEAIHVQGLLERNVFSLVPESSTREKALALLQSANSLLSYRGKTIQIVQQGEMETIACALEYKANAVVIDERITRLLIENPLALKKLMEKRLHFPLNIDQKLLKSIQTEFSQLTVIRSIELATLAFEEEILNSLLVQIPNAKRELLESVLWAIKLAGCAVSENEINAIVKKYA